jgi:hypothetical protein
MFTDTSLLTLGLAEILPSTCYDLYTHLLLLSKSLYVLAGCFGYSAPGLSLKHAQCDQTLPEHTHY